MILIFVEHGLGNQMFQYAMGIVIAQKAGENKVMYDTSYLPKRIENRKTSYTIQKIFLGNFPIASYHQIYKITGRYPWIYHWLVRGNSDDMEKSPLRKNCRLIKEAAAYRITAQTIDKIKNINWTEAHNYYVWGFWESPAYFEGFEDKIRDAFRFRHKLSLAEQKKYHPIFSANSVSVHIRRGDFLKISNQSFSQVCTDTYYKHAFEIIESKIKNPIYIFFSDDPAYVEKKYKDIRRKMIVKGNPDYIDMQLMTMCNHHICANSTFSFWGAFLGQTSNRIVIAPKYLYMSQDGKRKWIPYPAMNNWIQIES